MERDDLRLPALLIIMDGFGLGEVGLHNAISQAHTPCLDAIFTSRPCISIQASGESVGLPEGQMGNSEVGHLNIGAGRIVAQELTRIDKACADGTLEDNEVLKEAFSLVKQRSSVLHLMGLLSDGGVHSNNEHLYALMRFAVRSGVEKVFIHCFLDGRDVAPTSGKGYMEELVDVVNSLNSDEHQVKIASLSGRYYAMDRDNRWERVELAYRMLACCEPFTEESPLDVIDQSYEFEVTDEFVEPVSFVDHPISDDDAVIFFNFRPDRARELTHCFTDRELSEDLPVRRPHFVCLTEYDPAIPAEIAFPKSFPHNVLAEAISDAGLAQYHIAETEKYAHVTFFLNGGIEEPKAGEKRVLIPSPKVATYDLKPEMSEPEVAHTLAQAIDEDQADVYIVNFANCDMVGHTGVFSAAVAAVEAVDAGVAEVLAALDRKDGVALLTADHGNADIMIAPDGGPHTAHTTNPVPLAIIDYSGSGLAFKDGAEGALCNIAPTLLEMIGLEIPQEMDAKSLLA